MKRILPWLLLLGSCTDEPAGKAAVSLNGIFHSIEPKRGDTTAATVLVPWKALPEKEASSFLTRFQLADPGEFHVSAYHDYSYKIENYRAFAGEPLDARYKRLLSGIGFQDVREVYACHRFVLDDSTQVMLLRHSGLENVSSISMCLWDSKGRRFLPGVFLLSENDEKRMQRKDTRILRKGRGRVYLLAHNAKCSEEGVVISERYTLYAIEDRRVIRWKKKPADL